MTFQKYYLIILYHLVKDHYYIVVEMNEPLGNIETGFKLFDKLTPCISPNCVSSADSKIPKWREK